MEVIQQSYIWYSLITALRRTQTEYEICGNQARPVHFVLIQSTWKNAQSNIWWTSAIATKQSGETCERQPIKLSLHPEDPDVVLKEDNSYAHNATRPVKSWTTSKLVAVSASKHIVCKCPTTRKYRNCSADQPWIAKVYGACASKMQSTVHM